MGNMQVEITISDLTCSLMPIECLSACDPTFTLIQLQPSGLCRPASLNTTFGSEPSVKMNNNGYIVVC